MANILYLVHRMPYPPNKGDKVRSYHLLRHLQRQHRVFLGTFIDDPEDTPQVPALQALCPDLYIEKLNPRSTKMLSARGLLTGRSLSETYYRHAGMHRWVRQVHAEHQIDATVVFSGVMAQYATPLLPKVPMLVDFVDVDSVKWAQFAPEHRWPMSWLYRREGARLLDFERKVASQARQSFFVTPNETALFQSLVPELADRVQSISNGVNAEYFSPQLASVVPSPFAADEMAVVFTGAMDYWPNVDGVCWFVEQMLPELLQRWPQLRFYIVGRNPTPQVKALAGPQVVVTGTVPDVRGYLQHAAAVVAPLRVARGIQNKILEAMAMGKPVVTVPSCADAIGAGFEFGVVRAATAPEFVQALDLLLLSPEKTAELGQAARQYVVQHFSWEAHLSALDTWLTPSSPGAQGDRA
jgi:sugar transferase (PEP-CTERM/EpsH1 system associated)